MQRYSQTSRAGGHSFLLVPSEQIEKATVFAHEEGIERHLAILSIESFVATIIIGLAMDENKDLFSILTEIVKHPGWKNNLVAQRERVARRRR